MARKSNKGYRRRTDQGNILGLVLLVLLVVIIIYAVYHMSSGILGSSASILSVTKVDYLDKSGLSNNVSAYEFFVSVDEGSRYAVTRISPEMIQALGLPQVPNEEVRLEFRLEDFKLTYPIRDTGRHVYSLHTAETVDPCISRPVPWDGVDIEDVRRKAMGAGVSDWGAIDDIPGGSKQDGAEGSEWGFWMPNPSQVANCPTVPDEGDWKVIHVGGKEVYDVIAISSVAIPTYKIRISLLDMDGDELAHTYVTSMDRQSEIGDYLQARFTGSFLASQFQPIPSVDTILLRKTGTQDYYEVDRFTYASYNGLLQRLAYTDIDEFGYIFESIPLESTLTASPIFFDINDRTSIQLRLTSDGQPVQGAQVFFESSGGFLGASSVPTNSIGTATTTFASPLAGKYQIDAYSVYLGSDSMSSVQVSLQNPNVVLVSLSPSQITTRQTSTVTVSLVGENVGGANIELELDGPGSLDGTGGVMNAMGRFSTTYRPGGRGQATVNAVVRDKYGNILEGVNHIVVVDPPVRRSSDPAIGGTYILGAVSELNGLGEALPSSPPDWDYNCQVDDAGASYTCKPDNDVVYPTLLVTVWTDFFKGVYIPVGQPTITGSENVTLVGSGQQKVPVKIKNTGTESDTFDVRLDCPIPLSYVPVRVNLQPGEEREANLIVSGVGVIQSCSVVAESLNNRITAENPMFVGITPLCDYCDRIPPEYLVWTEYGGMAIEAQETCSLGSYYDTTLDRCVDGGELQDPEALMQEAKAIVPSTQCNGNPKCVEVALQQGGVKPKCVAEGEMMSAWDYWLEMNHGVFNGDGKISNPSAGWYFLDVPYCRQVGVYGMEKNIYGKWVSVDTPYEFQYNLLDQARLIRGGYDSPVSDFKPPEIPRVDSGGGFPTWLIVVMIVLTIIAGIVATSRSPIRR